jgi:hypothetical protein
MAPPDCSQGPISKAARPEIQSRNSPELVKPRSYARQNCIKSPKSYGSVPHVQRLLMKSGRIAIFIQPNSDLRLWLLVCDFIIKSWAIFFWPQKSSSESAGWVFWERRDGARLRGNEELPVIHA